MSDSTPLPSAKRKLFFGLFVFPLIIAIGMAVLLCLVVLLTHEKETPATLIEAIKTGSPGKRWQKAFELSNELNRPGKDIRENGISKEIARILQDPSYDAKTRGYMALALTHFDEESSVRALRVTLAEADDELGVFILWALGVLRAKETAGDILPYLRGDSADIRKTAAYVLGALGDASTAGALRPVLSDATADVRWNAALALARLGDSAGLPVLMEMMKREDLSGAHRLDEQQIEAVMINASKGLALIQKPEAIKILTSVSRNDKNLKVRQAALNALQHSSENQLS